MTATAERIVDLVPMTGERPDRQRLAASMSQPWISFAPQRRPELRGAAAVARLQSEDAFDDALRRALSRRK